MLYLNIVCFDRYVIKQAKILYKTDMIQNTNQTRSRNSFQIILLTYYIKYSSKCYDRILMKTGKSWFCFILVASLCQICPVIKWGRN